MKTLLSVTILLIFSGCVSQNQPSPTQNDSLEAVSPTATKSARKGAMQRALDDWLKNDWEKNTQGFESSKKENVTKFKNVKETEKKSDKHQKKSQKEQNSGFLQHYVDKALYYQKMTKDDNATSHAQEMETMPAIGSSKSRR